MQERKGWEWVDCGTGGYWKKVDPDSAHKHKLEFFCPHCKRITGTIDDKYLQKYGVCAECHVNYIEGRSVPEIDLSKYKKI